MSEYWFYHLETSTLQNVLPELLEKTLERGWTALVKLPDSLLSDLNEFLWTYRDDAFLPHGRDDQPLADDQPIILSSTASNSEGRECVFLIEGQDLEISENTQRCIIMINGRSEESVSLARQKWKALKAANAQMSYWQQSEHGKWKKVG